MSADQKQEFTAKDAKERKGRSGIAKIPETKIQIRQMRIGSKERKEQNQESTQTSNFVSDENEQPRLPQHQLSQTATSTQQSPAATRKSTKEEIVAAIKECAAKLGHVPSQAEMQRRKRDQQEGFCACSLATTQKPCARADSMVEGSGFMLSMEDLFKEWAGIVREMRRGAEHCGVSSCAASTA